MKKTKIQQAFKEPILNLVKDTLDMNKQAIIFVSSKPSAEKVAEDISKIISKNPEMFPILKEKRNLHEEISKSALSAIASPTKQCKRLASILKHGIAFHHAGLNMKQKEIIETKFKSGEISIIASTPTLAVGLDLPAFRTIIRDQKRFSGTYKYIPVLEYKQMAGRAGRPSYDNFGEAIMIAKSEREAEQLEEIYIDGEPEEIISKVGVEPVFRTYLLSLISSNFINTYDEITEFFMSTFWAKQYGDEYRLEMLIRGGLNMLLDFNFIKEKDDEKYHATLLGKRVSELYLDPVTAKGFIDCIRHDKMSKHFPLAILHMVSFTPEMKPQLRLKKDEFEKIITEDDILQDLIVEEPDNFDYGDYDYYHAIKTAMFLVDWINETTEDIILEKYNVRPGEIHAKVGICEWLLFSASELAKIIGKIRTGVELSKLRTRVLYGVKEDLLALLNLKGIGRKRARKLFDTGIRGIADIRKMPLDNLAKITGQKTAESIKKQVDSDTFFSLNKFRNN